jgi:hypothetical protein
MAALRSPRRWAEFVNKAYQRRWTVRLRDQVLETVLGVTYGQARPLGDQTEQGQIEA